MNLKGIIFSALVVSLLPLASKADNAAAEIARAAAANRQQVVVIPQKSSPLAEEETYQPSQQKNSNVSSQASGRQAARPGTSAASRTAITNPEISRSVIQRRGAPAAERANENSRAVRSGTTDFTETKTQQGREQTSGNRRAATGRFTDPNARQSVAEVGGRAVVARTGEYTTSNFDNRGRAAATGRAPRAARAATADEEIAIDPAIASMVKDAALTSCNARYEECMDQFCAVIDERQQRCSCSANLKNYKDAEDKLKKANQDLNAVAQNIRYVGLSAEEIRTLFTETEAETALAGIQDRTANRALLTEIENIISGATNNLGGAGGGSSGNMFDISLDGNFDMNDLFGSLGGGDNIANLRGANLRNAAAKKCKTIVDDCKREGVSKDQIENSYDLRVEKDCIEYEQTLTRMHESVSNNIRAANTMLQKARLAVLYDQNEYDFKGCVQALDQCVLEDTSCGKNYVRCLDPDRRFLDEQGKVILGGDLPALLDNFAGILNAGVVDLNNEIMRNLKNSKIGEPDKSGMCSDTMKRCRRLTFNGNKFNPENEVLKAFLSKAANQMKVSADRVVSDFASKCLAEVGTCYNTQVNNISAWTSGFTSVNAESVKNVMLGACSSVSKTCAVSIFRNDNIRCPADNDKTCIENLSEIFYSSLLCGPNMAYNTGDNKCYCMPGFENVAGYCKQCPGTQLLPTDDTSKTTCPATVHDAGYIVNGVPLALTTTCCAEVKAAAGGGS
ncbi:MAG: hypothetical protein LBG89_03985 [Rickettsiales bacterium]|jgi:hypothetical protein|nr:hypothetical protein [Rickettsiales bacterium]